jgi:hypothetical protein
MARCSDQDSFRILWKIIGRINKIRLETKKLKKENMTDLEIEAKEIVENCLKIKEEKETKHFVPTEWMEPFVRPFVHLQEFPNFSTKENNLCFGSFEISSIYGMYGITFENRRLYVREAKERKFLWLKWNDYYYREIHNFKEVMTTLSELIILRETKVWVKFADKFFEETLVYRKPNQ